MKFNSPAPTAPQWLAFLGSFVVPKKYIDSGGLENFLKKPVGTGPYKLAEYELNSRIVLERNDKYWGPKAKIRASRSRSSKIRRRGSRRSSPALSTGQSTYRCARSSASGRLRFCRKPQPISRVILLQVRNDLAFADKNVRLAAHHAIDKAALSKAFYAGAAVPLSVLATPGTPGYLTDFSFKYDPALAKEFGQIEFLARQSGEDWICHHQRPVPERLRHRACHRADVEAGWHRGRSAGHRIRQIFRAQPRRQIAGDDALQLGQCHRRPGILFRLSAQSETAVLAVEGRRYRPRVLELFGVADYDARIAGYRELERFAVENGATMPLLQSVLTVVHKKDLSYKKYGNGWMLAQTLQWT